MQRFYLFTSAWYIQIQIQYQGQDGCAWLASAFLGLQPQIQYICIYKQALSQNTFFLSNDTTTPILIIKKRMDQQRKQVISYPYMKKEIFYDRILEASRERFTLLSIAKNDILGIDLYLHFFPSIHSKKYHLKQKSNLTKIIKEDMSQFFMAFVNIVILRSFICETKSKQIKQISILRDLFDKMQDNLENKYLLYYIRSEISYQSDIYESQFYDRDKKNLTNVQLAAKVQDKIQEIISNLYRKLELQTQDNQIIKKSITKLRATQQIPENLRDKQVVRYIKNNFTSICNIKCLRRSNKRAIWQSFYHLHRNSMYMEIELIMQSKQTPKNNIINLPANTQEKYPFIIKLENYLNLFRGQSYKQTKIILNLCQMLIELCSKYNKGTKNYYPIISINDLFFDQKKLVPVFNNQALLLETIGLKSGTKNYQLKLATQMTPKGIDYYKTHLQIQKRHLLDLKYYIPNKKQVYEEVQRQNNKEHIELLEIQEKIHVEKLIRLIYFIQTKNNFTNDYYRGKFSNTKRQSECKPFYMDHYLKILQEIHHRLFETEQLKLQKIVVTKQLQSINNNGGTKLTFQYLKSRFGCYDKQDSLLEQLKYESLRYHIYELYILYKEICYIIFGKQSFRNLFNPKKYMFIFLIVKYLQLQTFRLISRKKSELYIKYPDAANKKQISSNLKQLLGKNIFQFNLYEQTIKINKLKKDSKEKLIQYENRKDSRSKYIKQKIKYIQPIKQQFLSIKYFQKIEDIIQKLAHLIEVLIAIGNQEMRPSQRNQINDHILSIQTEVKQLQIFQKSKVIQKIQQKLKTVTRQLKQKKQVSTLLQVIKRIQEYCQGRMQYEILFSLHQTQSLVFQFMENEIKCEFGTPQKIHNMQIKVPNQEWLKMCQQYNRKLLILTKLLFYINEKSVIKYQLNYKRYVIGQLFKEEFDRLYSIIEKNLSASKYDQQLIKRQNLKHQKCMQLEKYFL